jgi:hypothetical protein
MIVKLHSTRNTAVRKLAMSKDLNWIMAIQDEEKLQG